MKAATRVPQRVSRIAPDAFALALIAILVFAIMRRFWQTGVASNADMLIGVYRTFELDQSLRSGVLFPRIMPGLNFGYGGPLFQYYPPLTSYLALFWHWIGLPWIEANKAVFALALLLGGYGVYGCARALLDKRPAALVAASAYILSPYLLLNIYERGALAETLSLGLLPWLLWAAHRQLVRPNRLSFAATAMLTALLMLSHNITALFALPLLAFYLVVFAWRERRLGRLWSLAGAAAWGLALSAFYWAPALLESGFAQIEARMLGPGGRAGDNLHPLGMLVQSRWIHDYWGPERFSLSRWQGLVALLGIPSLFLTRGRIRLLIAILLACLAIVMVLQLEATRPFWEAAPLVRFIQFPWRLLGLASLWIALLLGAMFTAIPLPTAPSWMAALTLAALIYYPGAQALDPAVAPSWYRLESESIGRLDVYERGRSGFALYGDYAPASMSANPWDLSRSQAADQVRQAPLPAPAPNLRLHTEAPAVFEIQTVSEHPFVLHLPRIFFPGWRASIDGAAAAASASAPFGLVSVGIPAGEHSVRVVYGDTFVRIAAAVLSWLSLLALIVFMLRTRATRRILAVLGLLAAAITLLGVAEYGVRDRSHHPNAMSVTLGGGSVTLGDEVRLQGFDLAKSDAGNDTQHATWGDATLSAGDTLKVRLYWLSLTSPAHDYKVFIHLVRPDDSGPVAQSDSQPNLGFRPMTGWTPGELVVDEQWLILPPDLPEGHYRLLAGLYRPDTMNNLIASGQWEILPGDRIVLTDIDVQAGDGE